MRVGTKGADILFSWSDEDHFFFGLEGDDRVGDDKFASVVPTNDHYYGNEGKDRLYSYTGDDQLFGNTGADSAVVYHHSGEVIFDGGRGADVAYLMGFSDTSEVIEKGHKTIIIDGDCRVVMINVEDWSF